MNIILKGFDGQYSKQILERVFQAVRLGTVIDIRDHQRWWPDLRASEHHWMPAGPLRAGRYPSVDWTTITPLDEETVGAMHSCEAVFLTMVERYARLRDIPYMKRKQQYMRHLRYWNHILATTQIDLVLMNTIPHQCYDWVLYNLCQWRKVPVRYFERCVIMDGFLLEEHWEESGSLLRDRLQELQREYVDEAKPIPLSPLYEEYFHTFSQANADPWYMYRRSAHMKEKNFLRKWSGKATVMLWHKPHRFLSSILSPEFWHRKLGQHHAMVLYDRLAQIPDLSKPFLYVPLHLQPEASTCPMSGAYVDQERIVQLLAWHLPPGVRLYVKEHPAQEELCRSEAFYQHLREIPSVTLVPRDFDTFALTEHTIAVATGTGTAGFEALFRGKPVLMFGHRFFQFAPGVHRIRTQKDCADAIDTILHGGGAPTLREGRLFLRAIQEMTCPYVDSHRPPSEGRTKEEVVEIMAKYLTEKLQPFIRT